MNIQLFQVDAFTKQVFGGNPAAICPLEKWLPDTTMQAIAAENNLSETAFFVQEAKHYHIRWFTPVYEVDLCGHATLAAAHVLFEHLHYPNPILTFNSRSGLLTVERKNQQYHMNFPADQLTSVSHLPAISKALQIQPVALYRGKDDYLVILENEKSVAQLSPDFQLLQSIGGRGVIVSAPGQDVDFVSRCFYPNAGIDEDPVTGSAHTTMTPYWSKQFGKTMLTARQISKRQGELVCRLLDDRVELGGFGITYLIGSITI